MPEDNTTGASCLPVWLLGFEAAFERLVNQIVAMCRDSCHYREQHAKEMEARNKSVAPPSTPSDPRPTLLQSDGPSQFKSAVESALQSLGVVTLSKPQSKSVGPEGSGSPPPITPCAKFNEEQKNPNVTPASPNTQKPTLTMSTASPTLELPRGLHVAGREVLLSTVAGVSRANPTACNPSTSGRVVLPYDVGASNLEGCGQVRPLPPTTRNVAAESIAPCVTQVETRVPSTQSSGPEEAVGVHVEDEVLVGPNELVIGSSAPPPPPPAARATTSTSKRSSMPAAVEMETPTPQAERYRPGTRWTHEELTAVRHLLRTLTAPPQLPRTYSELMYVLVSCALHKWFVRRL